MKILLVDDEIYALRPWIDALTWEGHEVVTCHSILEACRTLYLPSFALVILDRMMPLDEVFDETDRSLDIDAGQRLFLRLRRFPEYRDIPVIVFTNYWDAAMAEEWKKFGERVLVKSKETSPSELVLVVKNFCQRFQFVSQIPRVLDDEHPNVAPYYINDVGTGERIRVVFEACDRPDRVQIEATNLLPDWSFGAVFDQFLGHPATMSHVQKLTPIQRRSEVVGLYLLSSPESGPLWYKDLLFETAPVHQHHSPKRRYSGVGRVCLARFLREFLLREGVSAEFKRSGRIDLRDGSLRLGAAYLGRDFLKEMGFTQEPHNPALWSISNRQAQQLLFKAHGGSLAA